MQMEEYLGNPSNLRMIYWDAPLHLNLGRWKNALCLKIGNEVLTMLGIHSCTQGP